MSENEKRIRAITRLYYSNKKIQELLLDFARGREVVPRYFEGFGKRPDTLQYPSDLMGLVNKGATSFHASEEIWSDPLQLHSEITKEQMDKIRAGWDLLVDIDSPFLDFSKIAARLLLEELENHGIRNYGIKFSGSKGFHIIISSKAFPKEYLSKDMNQMFPEWPRTICEYLMYKIKPQFSRETHNISNIDALAIRTNKKTAQLLEIVCPQCGKEVLEDKLITLRCDYCRSEVRQKKSAIAKKRILRCENCLGEMQTTHEEEFFECSDCKITNISKMGNNRSLSFTKNIHDNIAQMGKGLAEEEIGGFDLVLVAPRHLFRMPYSLHEKTALASVVLKKDNLLSFSPRDADPLKVTPLSYLPENEEGEARRLLANALEWKNSQKANEKILDTKQYEKYKDTAVTIKTDQVKDDLFPAPIRKLLEGLSEGKKRGLFILLTFLRCLQFSPEQIHQKIKEWNQKNNPPLKEGYVRAQIDWHLKQKKKILPPNYDNSSFYKDLGLIDKKQQAKNPLSEVMWELRKRGIATEEIKEN